MFSFVRKRKDSPLAAIVNAIQPSTPKYKMQMAASIRGGRTPPKDTMLLGTGRTPISPTKMDRRQKKVSNRRAIPINIIISSKIQSVLSAQNITSKFAYNQSVFIQSDIIL